MDILEGYVGWGSYLRIRVKLSILKPLAHGRTIRLNYEKVWIPINSEKNYQEFVFAIEKLLMVISNVVSKLI